jgi:hypothetical protein
VKFVTVFARIFGRKVATLPVYSPVDWNFWMAALIGKRVDFDVTEAKGSGANQLNFYGRQLFSRIH